MKIVNLYIGPDFSDFRNPEKKKQKKKKLSPGRRPFLVVFLFSKFLLVIFGSMKKKKKSRPSGDAFDAMMTIIRVLGISMIIIRTVMIILEMSVKRPLKGCPKLPHKGGAKRPP